MCGGKALLYVYTDCITIIGFRAAYYVYTCNYKHKCFTLVYILGNKCHTIQFHLFKGVYIQLRFGGILSCQEYTLINPHQKTDGITESLAQAVEDRCGCGFNTSYITDSFLQCFSGNSLKHVTYRAQLVAIANYTTIDLVTIMSEWVTATRGLVVERVSLDINHTCPLVIADSGSPECPEQLEFRSTIPTNTAAPAPPVSYLAGIIVVAVSVLVVVLILIVVIAMVILVVKRKRKATRSKKQVHFL